MTRERGGWKGAREEDRQGKKLVNVKRNRDDESEEKV